MGKQGPCYHCGINYTPLWRNGPPEKPVLCNACGSRWRTKGTLANYVPLHARVTDNSNPSDYKSTYGKRGPVNSKQVYNKRKETSQEFEYGVLDPEPPYLVGLDDDASNGSSSASGISYSEGCMQYGIPVEADNTGAALITSLWNSPIPSRKRTCIYRKRPSSVAKLTQGLRYMMDKQDSSSLSGFSEDLLFPCKSPISASEIGLGSYFIKQLQAAKQDDESEASSILVENRGHNTPHVVVHVQAIEASKTMHLQRERESSNAKQPKKLILLEQVESGPNHLLLEGSHCDKLDVLQSCHSPLIFVELKDILNYESFMGMLTTHEQKHLMAYVSPIDSCNFPDSLHSMFKSFQFEEALNNYQKLLSEGIFDMNILGPHLHLKKALQKHIMTDLTSTKWLEIYLKPEIKAIAVKSKESIKVNPFNMSSTSSTYLAAEEPLTLHTGHTDGMKSHVNMQNRNGSAHYKSSHFDHAMKNALELNFRSNSRCDIDGGFASSLPSSLIDPKGHIGIEGLERDLLLNVPSNASFQQAELLNPSVLKSADDDSFSNARNFEYSNSEEEMAGNLWGSDDNLEWSGLLWSPSKLF